jgi:hypothetical protein
MHEFVVPKSIPKTFAMSYLTFLFNSLSAEAMGVPTQNGTGQFTSVTY